MKAAQLIPGALVGLVFMVILALIFQNWLGMPEDVIDFLKTAVAVPALAAILTAWRAWSDQQDPPASV